MIHHFRWLARLRLPAALAVSFCALTGLAQHPPSASRQFPPGSLNAIEELPAGRFRTDLERLPEPARERALTWLRGIHFTELDLPSLRADSEGGIFYADEFTLPAGVTPQSAPAVEAAAVPISPFPAHLLFHSRPGAPNVLYLDFDGENVTGTQWNTDLGRTIIPAVAFSTDSDYATFSDADQTALKRIWQRVAEDYAAFNIDVTTERPATFTTRTAQALITRNTDANGLDNPAATAGGVAYVNVFASAFYAKYRPGWIYANNLANDESYIAEAASHEMGHNFGLSHDGRTDGTAYYGGHGSGDTSWGPLMGTGYGRNVSQWSKGEYYLANNTEDDLAIIAAKLAYRADDHANTFAAATPLTITGATNLLATTPENDPANTNSANKGVIERAGDFDVFSFTTGNGPINLTIKPWTMPAGTLTRGGNLDLVAELYNQAGVLLATNNPASTTYATLQTNLSDGLYYLRLSASGAGAPASSNPSGYTPYGSLGQYFITGTLVPSGFIVPPQAQLQVADITQPGQGACQFIVTYSDNVAIDAATLSDNDLRVSGPAGYDRSARLISVNATGNGSPRVATYEILPPNNVSWTVADNGTYQVWMQTNQVADTEGAWVAPGQLGQFSVSIATAIFTQNFSSNPGWTLDPLWQYGPPAYDDASGPAAGFTGPNILGYNLSGAYESRLPTKYATTPPINCAGASRLTLKFYRWLRLRGGDTALIQVSTNGTAWVDLWLTTSTVADTAWTPVQYALPSWTDNSPSLRLRWGLASNQSHNELGWNIDDVEILAGGVLDTTAPVPALSVADVQTAGSPSHSLTVTYTDDTALRIATLGSADILVTGPNAYSNLVTFVGVDDPSDGSPRQATYSVDAPGGSWDAADNGAYQLTLRNGEVADNSNNAIPELLLGSFNVNIASLPNVQLSVTATPAGWGSVSPASGTYPLGSTVLVLATPANYYRFSQWSGLASGVANPLSLTLTSNTTLVAEFQEVLTANHPTPYWWLAAYGDTNNFESAVTNLGANGHTLWQSYLAGLTPTNPTSQLRLATPSSQNPGTLNWTTVSGRLYTILWSTNPLGAYIPMPNASNLPWTVTSVTNTPAPTQPPTFFRIQVTKP